MRFAHLYLIASNDTQICPHVMPSGILLINYMHEKQIRFQAEKSSLPKAEGSLVYHVIFDDAT